MMRRSDEREATLHTSQLAPKRAYCLDSEAGQRWEKTVSIEVYEVAQQAIAEVAKVEEAAVINPPVTIVMPMRAAIEAICIMQMRLTMCEDSLQRSFRDNHLANAWDRAEIEVLRICVEALKAGIKETDPTELSGGLESAKDCES